MPGWLLVFVLSTAIRENHKLGLSCVSVSSSSHAILSVYLCVSLLPSSIFVFILLFGGTGVWTHVELMSRHSTIGATPPALFMLIIFWDRSPFMLGLFWTGILPFVLPYVAGMTGMCHCIQPLLEMEYCELKNSLLALNHDPPCLYLENR
jgi:hypothetical protein